MVVFLIPTGFVLASQNAIPGDKTYPVKRSLEKVILSLASLHPSTKAYFHADLMNRRFKEAIALFEKGEAVSDTLQELVAQTSTAAQVASALLDNKQKGQYIDQLSKSIDQYEVKLSQIEERVTPLPFPTPTPQEPKTQPTAIATIPPKIVPSPTPSATFCTADVRVCPEGSYVGRNPENNCQFYTCPTITSPKPLPEAEVKPPPTISPQTPTPIPSVQPSTFQPQPIYQTPPDKPEPNGENKRKDIDEAKRKLKDIKRRLDEEKKKLEEQHDNREDHKSLKDFDIKRHLDKDKGKD